MNEGYIYTERVPPAAAGRAVEDYLADRYRHSSYSQWLQHLDDERILIDGLAVARGVSLESQSTLEWHRPPWNEPAAPLDFDLLYQDAGLLVVCKPSGLPTLVGGGFLQHTLLYQLRLRFDEASPMHRLGRWTSGAVLCSRDKATGAHIAAQFEAQTVDKRYRALLSGRPERDAFTVADPIGPVPYAPLGTLHAVDADGRAAYSEVTVLERREASSLADVRIKTGRPHQIRIHMAAAGHALLGDPLYRNGGLPDPAGTALPGDPGYLLHAAEIAFDLPAGSRSVGKRVAIEAPVPERPLQKDPEQT